MKLTFNNSWSEKKAMLEQWHKHYALFPVGLNTGIVWFGYVERKGSWSGYCGEWTWSYREVS